MEDYGQGSQITRAMSADRVELIQMLFDGLIESMLKAKGHIESEALQEKSKCLSRAGRIAIGLQSALDLEKGGDLARNLHELYGYVARRLVHVNAYNDTKVLAELLSLVTEISQAWSEVPSLLPTKLPAQVAMTDSVAHGMH
jgi:flagellar protein FliS